MADSLRRRMMMGQSGGGETDPTLMYLTFEAIESGTFTFSYNAISYSLNKGKTWTSLAAGTASPTVSAGKTICWKATSPSIGGNTVGIGTFSSTGTFNVYGNVMSLSDGDDFASATSMSNYNFASLFNGATKLIDASNFILPCMTVPTQGYYQMFRGCTSLTGAPKLSATTLSGQAPYGAMFYGCSSLVFAPELPATSVPQMGYYQMFQNCTKLNYIKCLATSFGTYAVNSWVSGVASQGTFIGVSNVSWSRGASGVPTNWEYKSSAAYTRLLYSIFDHTCETLNTGVALFDGSITAYDIEMSLSDGFDAGGDILSCSGDGYTGLRIISDGEGLIEFSYRPITYDETLAYESPYDDLYISVRGDRQHAIVYITTNSDSLGYSYSSDWQYIPISQATLQYISRSYSSEGGTINNLRIFEVPAINE